ncbi:phosphotransferase [Arenicella xantha]|uniref:Ecdysteroid kinase n=1 Tax=Arenicella xantha TaxID=644221 RepID=A0A395JL70_9GAMM|nr:oxidoreductase family protein [Arenicella xantha]RBP49941.1 ecdysteroid kinase [Arenicella xantha]
MLPATADLVLSATGAQSIDSSTVVQSLWSGYGQIVRLALNGGSDDSVILKHIKLPDTSNHPRGWNTDLSHQRKVRSYRVEAQWYQHYAARCDNHCVVPNCLAVESHENETMLVLSDLDAAGYNVRKNRVDIQDLFACLDWLASFHATFLNDDAVGLWECGSYWHLDTRPDELAALDDVALRQAAPLIDQKLRECQHQTLVHGDAKLANFCFRPTDIEVANSQRVAGVDFQYVGRGCGMKDVAYLIGSCLNEDQCEAMESQLLDHYFSELIKRVAHKIRSVNTAALEDEWRELYPFAWADFHRFIKGWSPGHWKINSYSEKLTADVISKLRP